MKKILSVFAAAAVLFGFASCNGDLHDDIAPEQMYIIGALSSSTWDKTEPMTTVSTGVYTITTEFSAFEYGAGTYLSAFQSFSHFCPSSR